MKAIPILLSSVVLLAGCMGTPQREAAPVTEKSGSGTATTPGTGQIPDATGEEEVQVRVYEPPALESKTPVHGKAVVALLTDARRQQSSGDLAAAVVTLERALRIEPRNAHLWNRLAHLRFAQGRTGLSADLAAKSTTLAGGDVELKRDNWRLIAKARRAAGDIAGARVAERKARMLR